MSNDQNPEGTHPHALDEEKNGMSVNGSRCSAYRIMEWKMINHHEKKTTPMMLLIILYC